MFVVRPFIRLGDPHIHGGTVIKVDQYRYDVDAIRVACLGDMVVCPIPGHGLCKIVQCQDSAFIDGKAVAVLGSLTACGAALIPTQFYAGLAPLTPPAALAEFGESEDLLQPTHETDLHAMDVLLDFKRSPAQTPPQFAARLQDFGKEGDAYGYEDKYTQREQVRNAVRRRDGTRPPPKVWARFSEKQYLGDDNYLGRPDESGAVRTWLVDPDDIEHCGDNPEPICAALGIDYRPGADYALTLIDAGLMHDLSPGMAVFTPTFAALSAFCQDKLEEKLADASVIPDVLTPEFSQVYARYAPVLPDFDSIDRDQMQALADGLGVDASTLHWLHARWQIEQATGANRHYTGNGLTKLSGDDEPRRYGAGETMAYDREPVTIARYKSAGAGRFLILPLPHRTQT